MANKYTQMFFTILSTVHTYHTLYMHKHTKKRRQYTFEEEKSEEEKNKVDSTQINWKFSGMDGQANQQPGE